LLNSCSTYKNVISERVWPHTEVISLVVRMLYQRVWLSLI
jgi:hypothetical protein